MGWISKLFRKKKTEKADIAVSDLISWLEQRMSSPIEELNNELNRLFSEARQELEKVKSESEALENASIEYRGHIENKVKSVVKGHREKYLRLLSQFINSVEFPDDVNYISAKKFYSDTLSNLNRFSRETVKSFYTVQHLYHKQVDAVAKAIKSFDKKLAEIKSAIDKYKINIYEDTIKKIRAVISEIGRQENYKKKLEELRKKLESAKNKRMQFVSRLDEIKKGKEHSEYLRLKKEKEDLSNEINSAETRIIQVFSPLEHALKKYKKIALENEQLISDYVDNASEALIKDADFKILSVLSNLKNSILKGSVELKQRKKEKTLEVIDSITREELTKFIKNRENLVSRKKAAAEALDANKSTEAIKEAEYKIEHASNLVQKLKTEIRELEDMVSSVNFDYIISEIRSNIIEMTNVDVNIS